MAADMGHGSRPSGHRWRIAVWGAAACLLLLPLIAMRFDAPGVVWTGSDFVIMGGMLAIACGTWELGWRMSRHRAYRAAIAVAVLAGFLMTWANLAVGIVGNENNPLNLLFFGVLAVGIVGALLARFRPRGMARAMVAMAIAQALVCLVTLLVGEITFVVSIVFGAAWLGAAVLFRKAARET